MSKQCKSPKSYNSFLDLLWHTVKVTDDIKFAAIVTAVHRATRLRMTTRVHQNLPLRNQLRPDAVTIANLIICTGGPLTAIWIIFLNFHHWFRRFLAQGSPAVKTIKNKLLKFG